MPTYINTSSQYLTFSDGIKSINLGLDVEYKSFNDLDHVINLRRISDEPYYNPFNDVKQISGISDEVFVYDINPLHTGIIKFTTNGKVDLYINSINNLPAYPISSTYSFEIAAYKKINKIILKFITTGNLEILFLKYKEKLI